LIHVLTAFALFQSICPRVLVVLVSCGLIWHVFYLARLKTPGMRCSEMQYTGGRWLLLDDTTGELMAYTEVRVRFDFGWLMWLVFKKPLDVTHARRRDVLIFRDQIAASEHHMLRLRLRVCD
jgi:hypothetical protein